ncbi:MAG: TetR/AcrR family transcriptional regulator [Ruminiclostridium sp.]
MAKKLPKEIRIASLLMAAVEEFLEKGYEGASVDAIAKRAGVSKGGLYYHFPNKEVLLMEANRKLSEPIMEMIEKAYLSDSAIDGLKEYIKEYLKYWACHPKELSFFFLSMSKALESPVLMEYYKEYVKESTAFFVGMFQKAVDLGESKISDPEAYGISLMGALDGVLSYVMVSPEKDIEILAERFMQIWFNNN